MTERCTLLKFAAGPHCALNLFLSATGSVIPVEESKRLACGVPSAAKLYTCMKHKGENQAASGSTSLWQLHQSRQ